ncbi:ABC transporter permease, partial [Mesorhizobium sp. M0619]
MQVEYIGAFNVVLGVIGRFWPVWLGLALVMGVSFTYKKRLGLYGQLFDSGVGIVGVGICLFWLFTAIFASTVAPFDPLAQVPIMKDALPGALEPVSKLIYYFGGDKLARDVFSRMVYGSQIVLIIAPAATGFALMVGITLGLPAGYYGGRIDTVLSFLANLVLAFPVILLFYLLVTPGIMDTPIPYAMAGLFFLFPIIFFSVLFWTRYKNRPDRLYILLGLTLIIGGWVYAGLVFDADPFKIIHIDPNQLNIFVAVVFASSPGVFRIVRGLVMDIKTRDYVAAAQTRGESPWYIMLWEILPNARGPLIVDACLRIGYTTILLGTLGYFGLGLAPESP